MLSRRALALALASAGMAGAAGAANEAASTGQLVFPRDFGAHPGSRIEWWYVTGALDAASSQYGFQLTFFRAATGIAGAAASSRFAASQIIFAHAAVTDLENRRLRRDQRIARSGFGIAEASSDDTALLLRGWHLERDGGTARSRYRLVAASESADFHLDLDLAATQPVLLQGKGGLSQKGPDPAQTSYYYSEPQLAVRGTLGLGRGDPVAVTGRAWLDHEWSDSPLDASAIGWDWIGMNLDDGAALTAFRLRRADATTLWAGGSFRPASGTTRNFAAHEVSFSAQRRWTSPATKATYPVRWQVDTPVGRFGVDALLDDQELDSLASTGAIYWEGLAQLVDAGGRKIGRGYLEMTGYAGRLVM